MKAIRPSLTTVATFATMMSAASAQSLESAANYDIFVLNDGKISLKDANQLFGQVGFSDNSEVSEIKDVQSFDGTIYVHSDVNKFSYEASTVNPSGGVFTSGFDTALDDANDDFDDYVNYLDGLTFDESHSGKYENDYSLVTTKALTVIDFDEIAVTDEDVFSFTGRAGGTDTVIIHVGEKFKSEGAAFNLTNLDPRNVIWYLDSDNGFDLHKGDSTFAGTILSPKGEIILGEVDFIGAVYGSEMKLGSGFSFQGHTVPEPSSGLMLIFGAGSLLAFRRRKF